MNALDWCNAAAALAALALGLSFADAGEINIAKLSIVMELRCIEVNSI